MADIRPLLLTAQPPLSQAYAERDSGFPFRLSLPTVAPGQIAGALRSASLALHILPHKGEKAPQERFSEESFRTRFHFGNAFLYSSTTGLHAHRRRKPAAHSKLG